MSDQAKKTPAFRVFHIAPRGDASRAYWREIGVVWANSDGSFNLKLEAVPTDWTHTVQLRPFDEANTGERALRDPSRSR